MTRTRRPLGESVRLLYVVNEPYFFMSHRLAAARACQQAGYEIHVAAPADNVWAPSNFSVEELRREGFHYHPIPLSRRGMNPWREFATFLAIARLYRRLQPIIVHHLTIKPVLYGGVAARLTGVPAVVNAITGLGHMFSGKSLGLSLLRPGVVLFYRLAMHHRNTCVIVQNSDDGDRLVRHRAVPPAQIVLIRGSGVRADEFPASAESGGAPIVVLAGRLIWDKGVREFVAAARALRGEGVTARFVLIGNTHASNPRAVPEVQLRQWQAEGVVEWWGRRDNMPRILAESHIVCLPSVYGEGVPKVLVEAASSARAIVATDIPGCRDIVRHDENGLLVPPGDVPALTAALRRLIDDKTLRARLGEAGPAIVKTHFTEELVIRQTLAVYEALLAAIPVADAGVSPA